MSELTDEFRKKWKNTVDVDEKVKIAEDYNKLRYPGRPREKGANRYKHIKVDDKIMLEHRYIWEQAYGPLSKGWIIHHINGIKSDNRRDNLIALPRTKHSTICLMETKTDRIRELEVRVRKLNITAVKVTETQKEEFNV